MSESTHDALVGVTIDGRYLIESHLARGGMAKVYRATDLRLERKVAVKVMHEHFVNDDEYAAKFIREARQTARLAHPNIVSVFDQGHEGDILYLVMELLPGITLRELLNDYGQLNPEQALDIATAILQALSVAHHEGILHRDVKPENVMLVNDGRIKLGDFGLARPVTSATETGSSLLGTVAYIAPELLTRSQADNRSDLYSVGVMLYEMLTGKQPFVGQNPMQVAVQHAKTPMPLASDEVDSVSPEFDAVIQKATAKLPQNRHGDARAFLDDLRAASISRHTPGPADTTTKTTVLPVSPTSIARNDNDSLRTAVIGTINDQTAQQSEGDTAPVLGQFGNARKSRRGRVPRPAFIVVLVSLVALLGGVGWWFTQGPGAVVAPFSIEGLSADEAQIALTNAGLVVIEPTILTFDNDVEAGLAIGTSPSLDEFLPRGSEVQLVVSDGPFPVKIPDFADVMLNDYRALLTDLGIVVSGVVEQFTDDSPVNTMIGVSAAGGGQLEPGATIRYGDSVSLLSSAGRFPDVAGESSADATETLEAAGLTVLPVAVEEFSSTVAEGNVISVKTVGTVILRGDSVTLVVSKGPDLVAVPSTASLTIAQAKALLERAGFVVTVSSTIPEEFWDDSFAKAKETVPAATREVARGSKVTVYGIF
jgi:serine/threonine-protein kinase